METDQASSSSSKITPSRRKSTTTRKPSSTSRGAAQPASEGSRPPSIHHHSPANSNPSPRDSARGSSTSLDRDIMNEIGVNQIPVPSPFFSNNTQFSPDAIDQSMDPLNFLPLGQNTTNPYGLPLPSQNHSSNPPPPSTSLNPTNFADFFPPTRDPNTLAQQGQFFAFLQTQNPGALPPPQQQSQPPPQQLQPPSPLPSSMPTPMHLHGQLPFPHHQANGGFVPAQQQPFQQQQQQLLQQYQQQQQQQQQNVAGPSSNSNGQFGFEQVGSGLDMSFFNPQLALFGAGGGQNSGSSASNGGAGSSGNGHIGSGSSSGNNADEATSGIWAAAPNGFE